MIKKYRKLKGITQDELAEKMEMSTRQIQRLENGHNEPSLKTLKKLMDYLNIPDEVILKYLHNEKEATYHR